MKKTWWLLQPLRGREVGMRNVALVLVLILVLIERDDIWVLIFVFWVLTLLWGHSYILCICGFFSFVLTKDDFGLIS